MDKVITSVLFALPDGATLSIQFMVCVTPAICITVGTYGVVPCVIIIAVFVALLSVVGTFVISAVQFAAGVVTLNIGPAL